MQIPGGNLSPSAILLAVASITVNFTTASTSPVQVTGLTATVTIPSGGRSVKITVFTRALANTTAGSYAQLGIWDGAVGGTRIGGSSNRSSGASYDTNGVCIAIVTPSAGTKTYNVSLNAAVSGTASVGAVSTEPAFMIVELI